MNNETQAGPVDWVRSMLTSWLDRPGRDVNQLARWMRGLDLPPVGPEDEPFLWLLRGLPLGPERPRYERGLAQSAALLLGSSPGMGEPYSDRLIYNLLALSAGLRGRDELRAPLFRLFDEGSLDGRFYNAVELNHVLRSALMMNQPDARLQGVWEGMYRGRPHPRLGGTVHDGFEGVLNMPPSSGDRGKPAVPAISMGLTGLCSSLTGRPGIQVPLFRKFLGEAVQRYPAHGWEMEMVQFSHDHDWPRWTDMALPNLCVQLPARHFIFWLPMVDELQRRCEVIVQRRYCSGRILQVEFPEASAENLKVATTIERYRRVCGRGDDRAVSGLLSTALSEISQNLATNARMARTAREANEAQFSRAMAGP